MKIIPVIMLCTLGIVLEGLLEIRGMEKYIKL